MQDNRMKREISHKTEVSLASGKNAERIKRNLANGLNGGFMIMSPDPVVGETPGENGYIQCIINGLPAGTSVVSVWATENSGGASHAGDAVYETYSVQLFNNGTQCRVLFGIGWTGHRGQTLPSGLQVFYS